MLKKFKVITSCLLASTLGVASASFAFDSYFPPERISCTAVAGKELCEGFDPSILEVLQYSSHVTDHSMTTFSFVEAIAYYMTEDQTGVAFSYKDVQGKIVKLTAVHENTRPDFKNAKSAWEQRGIDLYVCNAGYMSCPITFSSVK